MHYLGRAATIIYPPPTNRFRMEALGMRAWQDSMEALSTTRHRPASTEAADLARPDNSPVSDSNSNMRRCRAGNYFSDSNQLHLQAVAINFDPTIQPPIGNQIVNY